jgi:endonuclease III
MPQYRVTQRKRKKTTTATTPPPLPPPSGHDEEEGDTPHPPPPPLQTTAPPDTHLTAIPTTPTTTTATAPPFSSSQQQHRRRITNTTTADTNTADNAILPRDSRNSTLTAEEKLEHILIKYPQSFCEELGIPMETSSPRALWMWLCVSILFSARIKSDAAVRACKALFRAGLTTPEAFSNATEEQCRKLLHDNGYEKYDVKTANFLVENGRKCMVEFPNGDINLLRQAANNSPEVERSLIKKFKGVGDGAADIFFREAQLAWPELYPMAVDKKSLKAARLVGLKEDPRWLAELCGNDKAKYVRLIAALVRIDLSRSYNLLCVG